MTTLLQNIIFDLDGTLVDSAPVFVEILNEMLRERGSTRCVGLPEIRQFASLGGPALVGGVLAQECGDLRQEVADFRARYALCPTPIEALYEGVAEGVKELAADGFTLAICSNKPQLLCEKVISDVGLASVLPVIVGSSPDRLSKPAPDLLELAMSKLDASRAQCLYVGDSEIDHALAEATGVRFAFVNYGYAADQFGANQLVQFSRFADLVQSLKADRESDTPSRNVA